MSAEFQEATATFQLAKMVMRICQIAFLVFTDPAGIVYTSYVVMMAALLVPMVFVWGAGVEDLWVVRLQYILGGVAVGLFEGTFLSVISSLGKNTKTFAIMGAPLGFFVNNTILGAFGEVQSMLKYFGMPVIVYYAYNAACLPIAIWIFHTKRPREVVAVKSKGKGCKDWVPIMIPWFIAKFIGNFVLEDGFPLLFNTFNSPKVPIIGGPESEDHLIPFDIYAALIWFPCMAAGDTISRRVPQYLDVTSKRKCFLYLSLGIFLSVAGEALDFLLLALVTALAAFIANFGNGFIYGLSAKFIDWGIAEEHRYAAYNLWCFVGDAGGYAGQGQLSVWLADQVCEGPAGSGEICTELCKQRFCRPGIRDLDGRTAWQVASFWGFDAAADSIFRALHYIPPLELRVEAPQDNLEPVQAQAKRKPSKQPKKGAKDKKQLQRPGSKEKPTSPSSRGSTPPGQAKRGSIASSQGKRGSVTSSQGKRGSLTSQGKRLSAASSQNLEGKPTTPSRASSKSKEKPGPQSASKDAADIAEDPESLSAADGAACYVRQELFPDAPSEQEQMPAEEAEAEDGAANPAAEDLEPGLTDEEEGPTRPPLPEDMGHRAGFQAVSDGRLEDAMVLASLPLWPFTNELNSRGWTLLHVAAHGGFEELCAALCHRKDFLCIDMPDKEFWATPLHLAAGKRRPECCNAIVQSGRCAKVNATDLNGQTPLHLAALRMLKVQIGICK
eukprot:s5696_g7.t1